MVVALTPARKGIGSNGKNDGDDVDEGEDDDHHHRNDQAIKPTITKP